LRRLQGRFPCASGPFGSPNTLQWLALTLTEGLGPTRSKRLVEHFGGVAGVFRASLTELEPAGLRAASAQSIFTGKSLDLAQQKMVKVSDAKADVVTLDDPRYPQRLKEIYDPPLVLYVRRSVEPLSLPGIAIVGTRHPTPYGVGMAERLACDLSNHGLCVISGLARGVDYLFASRGDQRQGPDCRRDGDGRGRNLSAGEQAAGGADSGVGWGADFRVRHCHAADAAEFSDSEPDH
jgi:DNA recombination-mediator protein A